MTQSRAAVLVLLALAACNKAGAECRVRTQKLRDRIAAIDGSIVLLFDEIPEAKIPLGSGHVVPRGETWEWRYPILIDDAVIKCNGDAYADDSSLESDVAACATTLRRNSEAPVYVIATKKARLTLVRKVANAARSSGEVRLVVRPGTVERPWAPSPSGRTFYARITRAVPIEKHDKWNEDLVMSVLVPAQGCSEAVDVARQSWMSPRDRLARLPDAFEKCACDGDMDTMAALYWFQAFDGSLVARWNAWDEAIASQLGDGATYEELAAKLSAKYLGAVK